MDLNDTLGALDKRKKAKADVLAKHAEQLKEYAIALNRICTTEDGLMVVRGILQYSGVFAHPDKVNPTDLLEERGKRGVYLQAVRPFLEAENRAKVESV